MQTELCIKCNDRPVEIYKRNLCKKCYQMIYRSVKKSRVVWPLDEIEVAEDIKKEIKKRPEYKTYIKKQADEVIKNI